MSRSRRVFNSGAGARRLVGVRSPSGVLVGVGGTMDRKRSAPDADSGSKLTLTFGGGGAKKKPKKKRSRRSRGEAAAAPPAVQVAADVDDDDGDDAAETNAQVELLLDAPCAPAPPSPCRSARPPAPARRSRVHGAALPLSVAGSTSPPTSLRCSFAATRSSGGPLSRGPS